MSSIYDFSAKTATGEEQSLSAYKGKVLLIVNTASKCGFTPQFEGLEALHETHAAQGLAVLGFPCNQFGGQDPGSDAEILGFCQSKYDVKFPMFSKVEVNGGNAHPLYQFLREQQPASAPGAPRPVPGGGPGAIEWNYVKVGSSLDSFHQLSSPFTLPTCCSGRVLLLVAGGQAGDAAENHH